METDKQKEKRIYEENLKAMNVKGKRFSSEDVQLVMDQCGCTQDKAIKTLSKTKGDLARAIYLISTDRI